MDRHSARHRRAFRLRAHHELLRAGQDRCATISCATPMRPGWSSRIRAPPTTALRARRDGGPLCLRPRSANASPARRSSASPASRANTHSPTAAAPCPLSPLAERYLDARYSPDAVARRDRHPADDDQPHRRRARSCRIRDAGRRRPPWTDWAGRRHEKMIGRPVSMHAMRGISRAFQRLPHLSRDPSPAGAAGRDRYARRRSAISRPIPSPSRRRASRPDGSTPNTPLAGPPLGFPRGPEDLLVTRRHAAADRQGVFVGGAARRARDDAHGDRQCRPRRSLSDRHAVPLHDEHGLELRDEHRGDHGNANRARIRNRRLPHPAHHLFRRLLFARWSPSPT